MSDECFGIKVPQLWVPGTALSIPEGTRKESPVCSISRSQMHPRAASPSVSQLGPQQGVAADLDHGLGTWMGSDIPDFLTEQLFFCTSLFHLHPALLGVTPAALACHPWNGAHSSLLLGSKATKQFLMAGGVL